MIARTSKTKTRSNDDALAAFVQRKAEIDTMLSRLQALSDEHSGVAPDEVTWGDVGSLEHHAKLLKRIGGHVSSTRVSTLRREPDCPPSRGQEHSKILCPGGREINTLWCSRPVHTGCGAPSGPSF